MTKPLTINLSASTHKRRPAACPTSSNRSDVTLCGSRNVRMKEVLVRFFPSLASEIRGCIFRANCTHYLYSTRCLDEDSRKRHDVLRLFADVFVFVMVFICLFVLQVIFLIRSNTRFKWVARQKLTVVSPFQPFWKRYRPAIKFSRE